MKHRRWRSSPRSPRRRAASWRVRPSGCSASIRTRRRRLSHSRIRRGMRLPWAPVSRSMARTSSSRSFVPGRSPGWTTGRVPPALSPPWRPAWAFAPPLPLRSSSKGACGAPSSPLRAETSRWRPPRSRGSSSSPDLSRPRSETRKPEARWRAWRTSRLHCGESRLWWPEEWSPTRCSRRSPRRLPRHSTPSRQSCDSSTTRRETWSSESRRRPVSRSGHGGRSQKG